MAGGEVAKCSNIVQMIGLLIGIGLGIWSNFDSIKNIYNKIFGKEKKADLDGVFSYLQKERKKEEEDKKRINEGNMSSKDVKLK